LRLTQLKLSGFKSFVDPTVITVPGQLVGVVGPNGCGKSNIIDAVRWVLGESKASALRGESMQDVIFNGSALRKPLARASVELLFDNSLGRAAGQWSQYADISVKRVLTRDGESTYMINNTVVRRRDVQDIFLGTGVGPRAYAIIEQGMISRVIEAKPEELRVFLEEAAGVSKYKERRRETEHRLEDTRENLARVDDIRRELEAQIDKLTQQAEVAKQYKSHQTEARDKQNMLWSLRMRDAEAETEKVKRNIEAAVNDLEAETARLREIESRLERVRSEHYGTVDAVNNAQGAFYEANSEVSRLETEIRYLGEKRQRLEEQTEQLEAQLAQWAAQLEELEASQSSWQARRVAAQEQVATAEARAAQERQRLPQVDEAFRAALARTNEARDAIARAEQSFQVEQTNLAHAGKTLQQLDSRAERLRIERDSLVEPDPARLEMLREEAAQAESAVSTAVREAESLQAGLPELESAAAAALNALQELQHEGHTLGGRLGVLQKIQMQVEENGNIQDWLAKYSLQNLPPLWQQIQVDAGWETAIESVLRERLHALELSNPEALQRLIDDAPQAKLSVYARADSQDAPPAPQGLKPLSDCVRSRDEGLNRLLRDWLTGYYATEGVPLATVRLALPVGAVLVNEGGHQFTRYAVSFHGPDTGDAGILARQREIEGLTGAVDEIRVRIDSAETAYNAAEQRLGEARANLTDARDRESAGNRERHRLQLELLRLSEGATRVRERGAQVAAELEDIGAQKQGELDNQAEAEAKLESHQSEMDELQRRFEAVKTQYDEAERALEAQRQQLQRAESELQEAHFAERECAGKLGEIERARGGLSQQLEQGRAQRENLGREREDIHEEGLRDRLQDGLAVRGEKESALATARNRQEELTESLRSVDEERMLCEQALQPLRDRINELRLKEQAARLGYEQFAEQLAAANPDREALEQLLQQNKMRPNALQGEINRLNQAMAELGAINMAALDELAASSERKAFLDMQQADLAEALATLESAIRRIDRETREMLQQTFDEVNGHFGKMFPALFGGGEAKLVMTGDEILDAGIEVQAQPPGKRNSTIHLMSGGEKALTAISLVFSLFQLNPAPFCLLDEVDAPLDDTNTERFCNLVKEMSENTQFLFISHNKITMGLASQLVGVTMQESGVSRVVAVDIEAAMRMTEAQAA
jgi:chromosome segregation protein